MQNLYNDLKALLQQDNRLVAEGQLLKNKIIELALAMDSGLLKLVLYKSVWVAQFGLIKAKSSFPVKI